MTVAAFPHTRVTRDADHRYWLDGRELFGVTRVLELTGISDFSAPHFTAFVRDRGAHVAAAIHFDNQGDLDLETLDPQLVPYVEAHRAFLRESGAVVEHTEQMVCDEAYGYAGTLDEILLIQRDGRTKRTLIDIKLGLYDSVEIQLAAYARAARDLYAQPVILERRALILKPDGDYTLTPPFVGLTDEQTFLSALRVCAWRKSHGCF
jgi:hypothetical protein